MEEEKRRGRGSSQSLSGGQTLGFPQYSAPSRNNLCQGGTLEFATLLVRQPSRQSRPVTAAVQP